MLVVGYSDTEQAWICRNSWGTGFGGAAHADGTGAGFFKIGYGQCNIDSEPFYGCHGVIPPVTLPLVTGVSRSADKLDVFAAGTERRHVHGRLAAGRHGLAWMVAASRAASRHREHSIHVVSRSADHLDAFCVGTDHHVYTAAWQTGDTSWRGWWRVGDLTVAPNSSVTAVSRSAEQARHLRGRRGSWASTPPRGSRAIPPGADGGGFREASRRRIRRSSASHGAPTSSTFSASGATTASTPRRGRRAIRAGGDGGGFREAIAAPNTSVTAVCAQRRPPRRVLCRARTTAPTRRRGRQATRAGGDGGGSREESRRRTRRSSGCRGARTNSTYSVWGRTTGSTRRPGSPVSRHGTGGGGWPAGSRLPALRSMGFRGAPTSWTYSRLGPTTASTPRPGSRALPTGRVGGRWPAASPKAARP